MRMDEVYLGPVPIDEPCAQVGEPDYKKKSGKEMNAFVDQLYRTFPNAYEKGVHFVAKYFPHDFGAYGEVLAMYDPSDEEAMRFAFDVESNTPYEWDDEAKRQLNANA